MKKNNLSSFLNNNDFDIHEPYPGHVDRFKRKLNLKKNNNNFSWKWLGITASVILIIGFYLGRMKIYSSKDSIIKFAPEMAETEYFFITTIQQELKDIERYRNIETETLIEDALDEIENLEEQHQLFIKELKNNNNKKLIIKNLINNYQQRLNILKTLLTKLENQKKSKKIEQNYNEII